MAYTVGVGGILELTVQGILFDQRVMNVFHYRVKTIGSVTDGNNLLQEMVDIWVQGGGMHEKLVSCIAQNVTNINVREQWVTPIRYRAKEFTVALDNGMDPTDCELPYVSASVELAGEKADRHGVGRKSIFGVPTSRYNDGRPTAAYLTTLGAFATSCAGVLTLPSGMTMEPVIFNRHAPADSRVIIQAGPKNEMRTQRSRVIGRGI